MKCPFCQGSNTRVIDSRTCREGFAIRRRRLCEGCDNRFTTYEQIDETPVVVVKKDQSRVPFNREKLRVGVEKACYKRPISPEQVEELAARIEATILARGETEVQSTNVGELAMEELRQLDQVAYVRFASVYREFKDINDFEAEIKPLLEKLVKKPD
ncbi:transcriptional regulator NrdR [Planctomycetes bacterium Pan216]|uniref:transcriptional regulator NrdR n=1 Tax=Kolteria novifilia TaxID=2527975 RepID=UPI0011A276E8